MKRVSLRNAGFLVRLAAGLVLLGLGASASAAETQMHHITLGVGYAKLLSDDMDPDNQSGGMDFTDSGAGVLAYRISVARNFDAVFESRGTISASEVSLVSATETINQDWTFTTSWFGPGLRLHASEGNLRPYAQLNFYYAQETFSVDSGSTTTSTSEGGVGFGVFSGVDIGVSRLISIPVEIAYLYADPAHNISSFGGTAGVTFNFGKAIE